MEWTIDQKLEELLRLPWTVSAEVTAEGDKLLRVLEIPSAVGSGSEPNELESDLWESLRESLRAYLHFGDPIPLPEGAVLPWSAAGGRMVSPSTVVIVRQRRQGWGEAPTVDSGLTAAAAEWNQIPA